MLFHTVSREEERATGCHSLNEIRKNYYMNVILIAFCACLAEDETKSPWLVLMLAFSGILVLNFLTLPVHNPHSMGVVYPLN